MGYYIKSVVAIIESNYENFTTVEKNIADFFIHNDKRQDFSGKKLAQKLFVSEASLSRFAQKCGFRGYREFIYQYSENFVEKQEDMADNVSQVLSTYQELLNKTYSLVDENQLKRVVDYLNTSEKAAAGEDYIIFNGPDEQFISGRAIGAEGGIGGTYGAMPELFLKMDELVKKGEFDKAREVQYAANEIIYKMCSATGNMYGVIKEILRINEKLDIGSVRAPLYELNKEDMPIVEEAAKMIRGAIAKYL